MQVNEYTCLEDVRKILQGVIQREDKRHQMDCHLSPHAYGVVEEMISMLDGALDYDPSFDDDGEPPMTLSEMHANAWQQHQEMRR